jgi:hypothetical protein
MGAVWLNSFPFATIGGLTGVAGEASAGLLPDVNAKAASKTTEMPMVLNIDVPPAGYKGRTEVYHGIVGPKKAIASNVS